jgi:glucose/arabinose dehydrogenase
MVSLPSDPGVPRSVARRSRAALLVLLAAAAVLAISSPAAAATLPPGFAETEVVSGLVSPTSMAIAPDGRIFVCEQEGRLLVIKNGVLQPRPFVTLPVNADGERGLLGVAFDPQFATTPYVYVYYTATAPNVHNRVVRFTAAGDVAVGGSGAAVLELNPLSATNHNGGALHFGRDGKLYVAVGENANAPNAQTLTNLLGKLLRINKDGTIPADNPFYAVASGPNRAIWALGLRNPYTFAFHRTTGRMFINDVGQDTWEEIDDGIRGSNYGWPDTEGHTGDPRFRDPLFVYGHGSSPTTGCAITGGAFYDPPTGQFPVGYANTYFFADFCGGWIRRYDPATRQVFGFASDIASPVDLRVHPDGSLYYLARGAGAVFRVRYTASAAPSISTQPADLTVSAGRSATFVVTASGRAPLAYQWERNGVAIPGATAPAYTLARAALTDDGARFRAVVRNARGAATSNDATLQVTPNTPPAAVITAPANRTLYSAGNVIAYAGTATDAEDGALPPSAFTWQVDFHHDTHVHPFMPPTSGMRSGSFVIPTVGETSVNVWYRIHLTVHDTGGLTATTFVDVVPRITTVTLDTTPAGLKVRLDGQPAATPVSFKNVVGLSRTIGVLVPQAIGGVAYDFGSWSDGGAATHAIRPPAAATTYTLTYRPLPATTGFGLVGTYFDNADLTGDKLVRIDRTVSFFWAAGSPVPGVAPDTYSVRWNGRVLPRVTGDHTFYVRSDGGVRLSVRGLRIVDDWTDHESREDTGVVSLVAGQKYDIQVEYRKNTGLGAVSLSWSAPGLVKQVVPAAALFPTALLVVPSAPLGPADAAVRSRLDALGYVPVVQPAATSAATQARGRALVLVSSTVDSRDVAAKFRDVLTPVLSWEPEVYDDLGMTGAVPGTDFGASPGQRLNIATPSHPLAAGQTGIVGVSKETTPMSWGQPAITSVVIARIAGGPRIAIFAYEKGARMVGVTAPGRRVGFFFGDTAAEEPTLQGWALFDAAVKWSSGR